MAGPSASDNYAGVYEGRLQPGSRPALLIVDVVAAYLTEGSALFMETAAAAVRSWNFAALLSAWDGDLFCMSCSTPVNARPSRTGAARAA